MALAGLSMTMKRRWRKLIVLLPGLLLAAGVAANQGRYMDQDTFLRDAFESRSAESGVLWVTPELRESIEAVLGRRFAMLRVRYWYEGDTTAWIIDEIGKEEPITIGVSVRQQKVGMVRVLEFRESRGWEIKYPFFTDQFLGAGLMRGRQSIDKNIDGITGATLSVAAVSRVVQLALMLDGQVAGSQQDESIRTAAQTL